MEILYVVYRNLREQSIVKHERYDALREVANNWTWTKMYDTKWYPNSTYFMLAISKIERQIYNLLICELLIERFAPKISLQINDINGGIIFNKEITKPSITPFEIVLKLIKAFTKLNRKLDGYIEWITRKLN
jgi:hypothetical protein